MITIKDVAKRAGVSISTVSRVINHIPTVTAESVAAVNCAIAELGYHPNVIARSLQSGRSQLFGIIVPQLDHPFYRRLLQAAEQRCTEFDYRLILCISDGSSLKEREFLHILKQNRVDGIIIDTHTYDISHLSSLNIPVVSVERQMAPDIPCVSSDSRMGGTIAAQMLMSCGVKHPCVIYSHTMDDSHTVYLPSDLRAISFIEEYERYGIHPKQVFPDSEKGKESNIDISFFTNLFKLNPEIDGVFANSDISAAWAQLACSQLNLQVPVDMKIVGFDGTDAAEYLNISTISQPAYEMGLTAVDTLISLISNKPFQLQTTLPVHALYRRSTEVKGD